MVSAADILDGVRSVYRDCAAYADTGAATQMFTEVGRRSSVVRRFSTAFMRPDRFRFEYRQTHHRHEPPRRIPLEEDVEWGRGMISWDGDRVRSWWRARPKVEEHESVHGAIAVLEVFSGGSAYTVPTLLIPGGSGHGPLPAADRVQAVRREDLGGTDCWVLEYQARHGSPEQLWIAADTFLIRKIHNVYELDRATKTELRRRGEQALEQAPPTEENRRLRDRLRQRPPPPPPSGSTTVESTTLYEPSLEPVIDATVFAFDPPR